MTPNVLVPHILLVAPSAYPLGGVQTWLDYLVPGLRVGGFQVTLGLVAGRHHDVERYLAVHPGEQVERISSPTGSREGRVRAVRAVIDRLEPDLVLGVNIPDAYPAVARARRAGRPVRAAMTVHGIQPDLFEDIAGNREVLDAVICTNRLACRLSAELGGLDESRIAYAPYGVRRDQTPRVEPGQPGLAPLRIAFVGRIEGFQKRVEDLVAIVRELQRLDVRFLLSIAGIGPREAWLRAELAEETTRGAVEFLGIVAADDLSERVYARSDALLITSSWETGPIVAWEAMAAGLPVVTSAYTGYGLEAGLVDGENCLVFPVGDIVAAVDALQRISGSTIRRRIVDGGADLVTRRYSREASIGAWVGACREIIARPPRASLSIELPSGGEAGRLDRHLGRGLAETVRGLIGRSHAHDDPGGEWPHSYGRTSETDAEFWRRAVQLDRRLEPGVTPADERRASAG